LTGPDQHGGHVEIARISSEKCLTGFGLPLVFVSFELLFAMTEERRSSLRLLAKKRKVEDVTRCDVIDDPSPCPTSGIHRPKPGDSSFQNDCGVLPSE